MESTSTEARAVKRYPIFAFFIDGYFLGAYLLLFHYFFKLEILITLIIGCAILATFVLYYTKLYKVTDFRMIGELITGTVIRDQKKIYVNPFQTNRIFLWIITFFSFHSLQKAASSIGTINFYGFVIVFLFFAIFITSFTLINMGKIIGMVFYIIFVFARFFLMIYSNQELSMLDYIDPLIVVFVVSIYFYLKRYNSLKVEQ